MSELVIRSSTPAPVWTNLNPGTLARTLWAHRELIRGFAGREVLERHKGAVLGVAWNVVSPLITLGIYTLVFGYIFGSRWERGDLPPALNFPLTFFAGHTFFHLFSETANRAPGLISSRPNLVRRVVFPLEILPVTVVCAGLVYVAIAASITLAVLFAATGRIPWTVVLLPAVLAPLIMLSLGVSWVLAAVGVFVRDMRQIVLVLTQLLMFCTPLFYQIDRIPPDKMWLRKVIEANPLSIIVENARRCMLWGEDPQWLRLGVLTAGSFVLMLAGYGFFMSCRRGMADVH